MGRRACAARDHEVWRDMLVYVTSSTHLPKKGETVEALAQQLAYMFASKGRDIAELILRENECEYVQS